MIFLSGQTPVDKNGNLVEGGIQEHTAQCLKNLENVLTAAGSSWEKVVKVNVYLKNMDNFSAMNEIYEKVVTILLTCCVYRAQVFLWRRFPIPNPPGRVFKRENYQTMSMLRLKPLQLADVLWLRIVKV